MTSRAVQAASPVCLALHLRVSSRGSQNTCSVGQSGMLPVRDGTRYRCYDQGVCPGGSLQQPWARSTVQVPNLAAALLAFADRHAGCHRGYATRRILESFAADRPDSYLGTFTRRPGSVPGTPSGEERRRLFQRRTSVAYARNTSMPPGEVRHGASDSDVCMSALSTARAQTRAALSVCATARCGHVQAK